MSSSLLDMANEVTYSLGNRTDLATLAKTWVNRSYQRLQDTIEFPESNVIGSIPLSVGTVLYAAPANFFSMISVKHVELERRVHQVSLQHYDRLPLAQTGPPTRYALRARTSFLVWPTPDAIATLSVTYRRTLAPLVNDGDLHLLPVSWEEPIIFGALAYGFTYLNETQRARDARTDMRAAISLLTDRLAADLVDRNEPLAPVGIQTGVIS